LQYVASASGEIYNLLTGNSQLTLAAILKLIDEDFLPRENAEWAKNAVAKAKQFLTVSMKEKLDIYISTRKSSRIEEYVFLDQLSECEFLLCAYVYNITCLLHLLHGNRFAGEIG